MKYQMRNSSVALSNRELRERIVYSLSEPLFREGGVRERKKWSKYGLTNMDKLVLKQVPQKKELA